MSYKIPDRLTFKRHEVTRLTKLDGKVIDYWAKEFGGINPIVNKMGETFYTRREVETILKIKQLMIEERVDKAKIKKIIAQQDGGDEPKTTPKPQRKRSKTQAIDQNKLIAIRKELQDILTILDKNGTNTL